MASPHSDSKALAMPQGQIPESPTCLSAASDGEDDTCQVNGYSREGQEIESGEDRKGKDDQQDEDAEEEEEDDDEAEDDEAEDDEDDEDEDDEDEDEEPALKYERITGAIPDLLKKDSASALAVSLKFMVCLNCR